MSRRIAASVAPLLATLALSGAACRPSAETPVPGTPEPIQAAAPATPSAVQRTIPTGEERQRLVAWWLRHDESYMLVIDAAGEDGRLAARYLNPGPVHVSEARAWKAGEALRLLIELTDEGYPGSFYELAWDRERDLLVGVYHHLGVQEDYEVYFTRFEEVPTTSALPEQRRAPAP